MTNSLLAAGTNRCSSLLNPHLTEIPAANATNFLCKARGYNTLLVITWIALCSLAVFVASTYPVSGTGYLLLFGLAIAGDFLQSKVEPRLRSLAADYYEKAAVEAGVARELDALKWDEKEVKNFLEQQGIPADKLSLALLSKINQEKPFCALLPLIARFSYHAQLGQEFEAGAEEHLNYRQNIRVHENNRATEQHMIHASRTIGMRNHLHFAIPHTLNAALMLQLIARPTLQYKTIADLGSLSLKEPAEARSHDRDDPYFICSNGRGITLTEIERKLTPTGVRPILFPGAIQV